MATIAELNDAFREALVAIVLHEPIPGVMTYKEQHSVYITSAVLGFCRNPMVTLDLLRTIQGFNDFDEDNDPYCEHDFLMFDWQGQRIYAKIDYYDNYYKLSSDDPSDPYVTKRVMTILFPSEY
jgi:hypothetical protein